MKFVTQQYDLPTNLFVKKNNFYSLTVDSVRWLSQNQGFLVVDIKLTYVRTGTVGRASRLNEALIGR